MPVANVLGGDKNMKPFDLDLILVAITAVMVAVLVWRRRSEEATARRPVAKQVIQCLALGAAVVSLTGCATSAVISAGTERRILNDRIDSVERAYAAPNGRVSICVRAAVPQDSEMGQYTIEI